MDEEGREHRLSAPVKVKAIRTRALRWIPDGLELTFDTEQGRRYVVKTSDRLDAPAEAWVTAPASQEKASGWSAFSDRPFNAGPGSETRIRMRKQAGRKSAYYKIILSDD